MLISIYGKALIYIAYYIHIAVSFKDVWQTIMETLDAIILHVSALVYEHSITLECMRFSLN